jgi:hypothetical protein
MGKASLILDTAAILIIINNYFFAFILATRLVVFHVFTRDFRFRNIIEEQRTCTVLLPMNTTAKFKPASARGRIMFWRGLTLAWVLTALAVPLRLLSGELLTAGNAPPQPSSLLVTGTVQELLPKPRFDQSEIVYRFALARSDEKWQIDIRADTPVASKVREGADDAIVALNPSAETIYGEGMDFYVLQSYTGFHLVQSGEYLGSYDGANDLAAIGSGRALHGSVSKVGIALWYMFLSADYLKDRTEGKLHNIRGEFLHSAHNPEDVPQEATARWELLAPGGLPRMIVVSNAPGGQPFMQKELIRQLKKVPHTNTLFQVTETTNIFGYEFPAKARVQYYHHNFGNDTHHVEPGKTILISVHSFAAPGNYPIQKPNISRATRISDQRYWSSNPPAAVSIVMSNAWPDDSVLTERYARRTDYEQGRRPARPSAWLFIMAIILCAPLLLWKLKKTAGDSACHSVAPNLKNR